MKFSIFLTALICFFQGSVFSQPINDMCATAVEVVLSGSGSGSASSGTTIMGATESIPPSSCSGFTSSDAEDVWFKFTATHTSHIIDACPASGMDAVLEVRQGPLCTGTVITCIDDAVDGVCENTTLSTVVGEIYFIRVYDYTTFGFPPSAFTFTLDISAPPNPNLSFSSFTIDDDSADDSAGDADGLAEPGESIELPVLINNSGSAAATSVSATLTTTDPDISITDGTESYGTLAAGTTSGSADDFDFDVSLTSPDKDVTFVLSINATEGSWVDTFTLHITNIGTPNLAFSSFTIDDDSADDSAGDADGLAEPGESIELPVLINNSGSAPATSVSATLSTVDPDISITDGTESYGTITAGTTSGSSDDFDFDVSPTSPDKDVTFVLSINATEGSWVDTFTLHITNIGIPDLAFSSFTIDDDSMGDSAGDGDGIIEPGETIELDVALSNGGSLSATDVEAFISESDPDLTLVEDYHFYGNIAAGTTSSGSSFVIEVDPSSIGKEVPVALSISSIEGTWLDTFEIQIVVNPSTYAPSPIPTNATIHYSNGVVSITGIELEMLQVFDLNGIRKTGKMVHGPNSTSFEFDQQVAAGIYVILLKENDGAFRTHKVAIF